MSQDDQQPPQQKRRKIDAYPSFRLNHTDAYQGSFPVYKQPQEITSYSIDHERRVWFDNREMVLKETQDETHALNALAFVV